MAPALEREADRDELGRVVDLLGGSKTLNQVVSSPLDAHELIVLGFPGVALTRLVANVALIQRADTLEKAIGISKRTLQRRKGESAPRTLSPEQSGRAWKFAEILSKATTVFGTQQEAERWMEEPAIGLNQRRPIDLLSTPAGTELVESYLEQIEYGVYA